METQLEIVCKQSPDSSEVQQSISDISSQNITNNNPQWLQNIINKLRELTRPEKQSHLNKTIDDDWEVPFERITMCQRDFQRCGSQGEVFYGKLSNTPVAIKRVKDVSLTKIRHLRELSHKNIIKFRGISQNSNYHFILMEWCQYGTLHDHIHSGRQLSATILSDFAQQIANGMKYLHSKKILHRDLKPSNILLTKQDVLKISDFGTHKVFCNDKLPVTSVTYAGTHAYMAPEVIRSEPYSFPIDVWSYGVVLWEILTSDEPYKNLDSSAVVWAVGNNSFKLPVPSNFPAGFSRILDGCWQADPVKRFTFQQVCMILKGATHEIDKISKERWQPLQAAWKREIRDELNKHLQFKNESNTDQISRKDQAYNEIIEAANKRLNKNNYLYLKLQETCLLAQREREELAKREEELGRREENSRRKEEELAKEQENFRREQEEFLRNKEELNKQLEGLLERERIVAQKEAQFSERDNEFNRIKIQNISDTLEESS